MDVHAIDMVPQQLAANYRQDVTTQAGELVSFEWVAEYRVCDANLAHNAIYDYEGSVQAIIRAVLADRIASVKPERLRPEGRARLLSDLRGWAKEETELFGVEVVKIRFASFVTNVRTIRLLGEYPSH
jgi:regulator of protease activity HflC (stomatin/prohibitin superfamily)